MLAYWLGRCEGFDLVSTEGSQLGVVDQVMLDDAGHARALVMRTVLLGRRRIVDPRLVEAVVPERESIAVRVEPAVSPRNARKPLLPGGRRLRAGLVPLLRSLSSAGARSGSLAFVASRWAVSRLRRDLPVVVRVLGRATAAATRWARPRVTALAHLAGAALVGVAVLVVAIARELALALRAYREARAREAARRRAAA